MEGRLAPVAWRLTVTPPAENYCKLDTAPAILSDQLTKCVDHDGSNAGSDMELLAHQPSSAQPEEQRLIGADRFPFFRHCANIRHKHAGVTSYLGARCCI